MGCRRGPKEVAAHSPAYRQQAPRGRGAAGSRRARSGPVPGGAGSGGDRDGRRRRAVFTGACPARAGPRPAGGVLPGRGRVPGCDGPDCPGRADTAARPGALGRGRRKTKGTRGPEADAEAPADEAAAGADDPKPPAGARFALVPAPRLVLMACVYRSTKAPGCREMTCRASRAGSRDAAGSAVC
ncbi:hypothetical protein GCM10018966_094660 [Streptomyces yanii]